MPRPSAGPASTARAALRAARSGALQALRPMFAASRSSPATKVATETCASTVVDRGAS